MPRYSCSTAELTARRQGGAGAFGRVVNALPMPAHDPRQAALYSSGCRWFPHEAIDRSHMAWAQDTQPSKRSAPTLRDRAFCWRTLGSGFDRSTSMLRCLEHFAVRLRPSAPSRYWRKRDPVRAGSVQPVPGVRLGARLASDRRAPAPLPLEQGGTGTRPIPSTGWFTPAPPLYARLHGPRTPVRTAVGRVVSAQEVLPAQVATRWRSALGENTEDAKKLGEDQVHRGDGCPSAAA